MTKLVQLKDEDGNVIYPDISGLFLVESRVYEFGGVTVPAGSKSNNISFDVSKQGYKPLGIVAINGSGTSGLSYNDWYFDTDNSVRLFYANNSESSNTLYRLRVFVLYLRVS